MDGCHGEKREAWKAVVPPTHIYLWSLPSIFSFFHTATATVSALLLPFPSHSSPLPSFVSVWPFYFWEVWLWALSFTVVLVSLTGLASVAEPLKVLLVCRGLYSMLRLCPNHCYRFSLSKRYIYCHRVDIYSGVAINIADAPRLCEPRLTHGTTFVHYLFRRAGTMIMFPAERSVDQSRDKNKQRVLL